MGMFGDIFGGIGDIAGLFSGGGADDAANQFYIDQINKMRGIDPTITAQQAGPSDQSVPQDVMRELQQTYRSGGLDAISKGQIAEATAGANRNAQANREAVLSNARARGTGNSGVTAALQEMGGQEATQDANLAASRAAATAEGNRRGALGQAGALGVQSAAAQDAVNRFNAAMRQGAAESTFGNKMGQLESESNIYGGAHRAGKAGEDRTSRLYGSIGRQIGGGVDAIAGMPGGGGGYPSWLKQSPLGGASYT